MQKIRLSQIKEVVSHLCVGCCNRDLGLTDPANYSTTDYITGGISIAAGSWVLHSLFSKKPSENDVIVAPVADTRFEGNVGLSVNYRF